MVKVQFRSQKPENLMGVRGLRQRVRILEVGSGENWEKVVESEGKSWVLMGKR